MKEITDYLSLNLKAIIVVFLFAMAGTIQAQITIHTINVKSSKDMVNFFRHTVDRSPLLSAHRGGLRPGFPENCMATFENTLQYTPAIFEIDPHITKDSMVVLMHDATLDRTTTGSGKVCDYTWEELKQLKLKDRDGNITPYGIPLLEDVLKWGKGKTIFVLDDKDVPHKMITELVQKLDAFTGILMTVRNADIAREFYQMDRRFMFEAYVFDMEDIEQFEAARIPWTHVMAYIGSKDIPANTAIYEELNSRGVKGMVSGAPSLDKVYLSGTPDVYQNIFNHGADIIETDLPIHAALQISSLINHESEMSKYFGTMEIPLDEVLFIPSPLRNK